HGLLFTLERDDRVPERQALGWFVGTGHRAAESSEAHEFFEPVAEEITVAFERLGQTLPAFGKPAAALCCAVHVCERFGAFVWRAGFEFLGKLGYVCFTLSAPAVAGVVGAFLSVGDVGASEPDETRMSDRGEFDEAKLDVRLRLAIFGEEFDLSEHSLAQV